MKEIRSWSEARTQDDSVDDANRYPLDHESLCFHITFKQCFQIIYYSDRIRMILGKPGIKCVLADFFFAVSLGSLHLKNENSSALLLGEFFL